MMIINRQNVWRIAFFAFCLVLIMTVMVSAGEKSSSRTHPTRIVSLALYPAEILCDMGEVDRLVAVGSIPKDGAYDHFLKEKPRVGSSYGHNFNLELVLGYRPDFIFCSSRQAELLKDTGIPIYITGTYEIDAIMGLITDIGRIVGNEEKAAEMVESMNARIKTIEEKVKQATYSPKVYFEQSGMGKTRAKGSLTHELITRAGGINIAKDEPVAFPILSQEFILMQNPDIIIVERWGTKPEEVLARDAWKNIPAVKNGKILISEGFYTGYTPRCLDGLEAYAKYFFPELFDE